MASKSTAAGYGIIVSVQTAPKKMTAFKNALELGLAFQQDKEQWIAFGEDGWKSAAIVAKNITAKIKLKRTLDDAASDYILLMAKGSASEQNNQVIKVQFPLTPEETKSSKSVGENWVIPCVIEVGNIVGSAKDLQEFEITITSDGKPTYTEAA